MDYHLKTKNAALCFKITGLLVVVIAVQNHEHEQKTVPTLFSDRLEVKDEAEKNEEEKTCHAMTMTIAIL